MTDQHLNSHLLDPAISQLKVKKATITMAELEKSMISSSISSPPIPQQQSPTQSPSAVETPTKKIDSIDYSKYYPIKKESFKTPMYTFPPPLIPAEEEQLARVLQNPSWKCPPPPKPLEEWPFQHDVHRGIMSRYEREGISRMHLGQLSTDDPELEDYYYKNYTKQLRSSGSTTKPPLYLPIPSISQRKAKGVSKDVNSSQHHQQHQQQESSNSELQEVLSKSLGHGSLSSVTRKARQTLLQPSQSTLLKQSATQSFSPSSTTTASATSTTSTTTNLNSNQSNRYALPAMIEKLNELSNIVDYHLQISESGKPDKASLLTASELSSYMRANLAIDGRELGDIEEEKLLLFINLLNHNQGAKALGKTIKTLSLTGGESVLLKDCLDRIIEIFEYLDVCSTAADELKSTFIDNIFSSFVPFISEQSFPFVMRRLELLSVKKEDDQKGGKSEENLCFLLQSRASLVLFCILMSRAEIMMKEDGLLSDAQREGYCSVVGDLFNHLIQNNICDLLFPAAATTTLATTTTTGAAECDLFYTWQFLALLSLNIDSDSKKTLIMELREKIMQVIESGLEKGIANLNVFLNSLGLDASQLG